MKEITITGEGQASIVNALTDERSRAVLEIQPEDEYQFVVSGNYVYLGCDYDYKKICEPRITTGYNAQRNVSFKDDHERNYNNRTFKHKVITSEVELQSFRQGEHKADSGSVKPVVLRLTKQFYSELQLQGFVTETPDPKAKNQSSQDSQPAAASSTNNEETPFLVQADRSDAAAADGQQRGWSCSRAKVLCGAVSMAVLAGIAVGGYYLFKDGGHGNNNDRQMDLPNFPGMRM